MKTSYDHRLFDPDTAIQAAISNRVRRGTHRFRALELLAYASLTDFELAERSGIQQTSIGKRRKELMDLGFVEPTRTTRAAPSGSQAIVWQITSAGFAFWNANREAS